MPFFRIMKPDIDWHQGSVTFKPGNNVSVNGVIVTRNDPVGIHGLEVRSTVESYFDQTTPETIKNLVH
jgi:hypothetical protein